MGSIRKALVVDDDDDMLSLCQVTLRRCTEWQVEVAQSAEAAIEAACSEPPDVILLDVMMPDGGGLALLRRLKEHHATARVPVVLMTAAVAEAAELLTHGAAGLIAKPFDPTALPASIIRILSGVR